MPAPAVIPRKLIPALFPCEIFLSGFLPGARRLEVHSLAVRERQVRDTAGSEADQRRVQRHLDSLGQLTLAVDYIVDRASRNCLRWNRAYPEVAVRVRAGRARGK